MRRLAALLLLLALVASAATLEQRIEKVLSEPAARRAFWGVKLVDLESGATLYQLHADHFFVPASNTKLFSTALALERLGPDHRFVTRLAATASPDAEGRIAGDLILVGGGDPNFSARALPYEKQTQFGPNRLAPIEELAAEVADAGVRQIDGDVVGDDTFYVWERYPPGWSREDLLNGDGAPITALVINDNVATLTIRPGAQAGEPAVVRIDPPSGYFTIDNRVRTVAGRAARPLRVGREPGERTVHLWGEIALDDKGHTEVLAIDDPALFAAQALHEALMRHSVAVLGRAASRHLHPYEEPAAGSYPWVVASRSSLPLIEDLRLTNKISQNLHAELALRAVARERQGAGTIPASLAEMKDFLEEAGIGPPEYFFRDGSGLSRQNLVSPATIVKLLAYMWRRPGRELWLDTLPVAGFDGTLRGRLVGMPATARLRAKTGSLAHAAALSGYLDTPEGRRLAFSVMVNNFHHDAAALRALIDRICLAVLAAPAQE